MTPEELDQIRVIVREEFASVRPSPSIRSQIEVLSDELTRLTHRVYELQARIEFLERHGRP